MAQPLPTPPHWTHTLPPLRGTVRHGFRLAESTWFQVGGPAELFFKPADSQDLADFLRTLPPEVPVFTLGVGSNLLVRDGGVSGAVIRLGRGFTDIRCDRDTGRVTAGAGALGRNVALQAQPLGLGGLAFLTGIPGTVGGAVAMNAGAYGRECGDCLESVTLVTRHGEIRAFPAAELPIRYRHGGLPEGAVVTEATFRTERQSPEAIAAEIAQIAEAREASQPLRTKTGGSTFKNPEGRKAWQLVDAAGCRGLRQGDAQVSEKHCNFLINHGSARAADIEALGEEVRRRVREQSGIELQWEIHRVGHP